MPCGKREENSSPKHDVDEPVTHCLCSEEQSSFRSDEGVEQAKRKRRIRGAIISSWYHLLGLSNFIESCIGSTYSILMIAIELTYKLRAGGCSCSSKAHHEDIVPRKRRWIMIPPMYIYNKEYFGYLQVDYGVQKVAYRIYKYLKAQAIHDGSMYTAKARDRKSVV